MGRPPLNMKLINVRFPPEMIERIDAVAGPHRRPQFVRDAVEHALRVAETMAKLQQQKK